MRLYLVSRADLPPGRRAAMLCHAVHTYTETHGQVPEHTAVVLLEVPDEGALEALRLRAAEGDISHGAFYEPDLNNELAAIALSGEHTKTRRVCAALPLAFS